MMDVIAYVLFVGLFLSITWAVVTNSENSKLKKFLQSRKEIIVKQFAKINSLNIQLFAEREVNNQIELENKVLVLEVENYRRELCRVGDNKGWIKPDDLLPCPNILLLFIRTRQIYIGYFDAKEKSFRGFLPFLLSENDYDIQQVDGWRYLPDKPE